MKTAIVCLCMSLFVASNAFILGNDGMRGLMTLNMLSNRSPFDMSMFGMGGQQAPAAPAASAQGTGAASTAAAATAGRRRGLFSNPLIQLSLLGGEGFF